MGIPAKIITFIIQAALVILAVFLFSFFDPFNIFNSRKLTLKDTPTIVESIRGIGELITAEYYGEVIKSTGEPYQLFSDSIKGVELSGLIQLEGVIRDIGKEDFRRDGAAAKIKNRKEYAIAFASANDDVVGHPLYGSFLEIVNDKTRNDEKDMLYAYYNGKKVFPETNGVSNYPAIVSAFLDEKYRLSRKEMKESTRNGLVLLGRGSVRAGIDFSNFDKDHFQYFPARNLVRLTHHRTEIINVTINPWFIPEKKIKGFEYIYVGSNLEKDPDKREAVEIIRNLKEACVQNLRADAKKADIIGKAKVNAEATLGHLLSLLMGKEIQVEIYEHPLDASLHDILKTEKLDPPVINEIDSLVGSYVLSDYSRTFEFLKDITDSLGRRFTKLPWKGAKENLETLSLYYKIAEDNFYSKTEKDTVSKFLKAGFTTVKGLKSILYLAMAMPPGSDFSITESMIPDSALLTKAFEKQKTHYDSLVKALSKLRDDLTVKEIHNNDSIVDKYLKQNKLEDAYRFAGMVTNFIKDKDEDSLRFNWNLLYLKQSLSAGTKDYAAKALAALNSPTEKDCFYYMFYEDIIPKVLASKKKVAEFVKSNPELEKRIKQQYARSLVKLRSKK